jgi:putative molybdopterin biosynthesis protein
MTDNRENKFIKNEPVEIALENYLDILDLKAKVEVIRVEDALGRITSKAVIAKRSSPSYHSSAMDGISVLAEKTYGASEVSPIILKSEVDFEYVNTGNSLSEDKDAVIMIEDVFIDEEGNGKIIKSTYPWENIRTVGEDIVKGELIIPSKHKIRPLDFGSLLNGGIREVEVYKKVKVGILPTGDEIVQSEDLVEVGKIIDSNSLVFKSLVEEIGGIGKIYPVAKDENSTLKDAIKLALEENDFLIINAGSSAGKKDFTRNIIEELGQVISHGVAMKPGKPTILGKIANKAVIGIPGYPVSSYVSFKTFAEPILSILSGIKIKKESIEAILSKRIVSSLKYKEIVRMTLGEVNNKWIATPLTRGAGATMSLVKADALLEIPREVEGFEAGSLAKMELLKDVDTIKEKVLIIGSHDLILDYMADLMPLSSGHVGSFGGILALKKEQCHLAPIHLLNEKTGEYNSHLLSKHFEKDTVSLIKGVKRLQGFIVKKANPKNIKSFEDLLRADVSFVNRQRGAGTRQLLDYNLNKLDLDREKIKGYEREFNTHMAVAVAVQSDSADVALGIYSASQAMDLDFVELVYEEYDFAIHNKNLEDERVKDFIRILKSEELKTKLEEIGGYKLDNTGEIIKI